MEIDIGAVMIGVGLGIGLVALWGGYHYHRIKRQVDQIINKAIAEAEDQLIGLEIEVDNHTYFCYNSKDKQFVCQGKTAKEIQEAFGRRYPEKTAYLAGGDPVAVENFKTELLKLATNETSPSI